MIDLSERFSCRALCILWLCASWTALAWGQTAVVVLNEIHYDPDVATAAVEFIELYNPSDQPVSLSGWSLTGGVEWVFPPSASLPAHGYGVVAESPAALRATFGLGASTRIWGPWRGRLDNEGETVVLRDATGERVDEVDYRLGFPWPTVGDPLSGPGSGPSIQLLHPNLDNDLGGSWRSAAPTPAARNSAVYTIESPTWIRQVRHRPEQPRGGDPVTITAKVTDDDGIRTVRLRYQIVTPGQYVPVTLPTYPQVEPANRPNPQYNSLWLTALLRDDGTGGDAVAGDDVYTVVLPASVQRHRRLVRYRLEVTDGKGATLRVPYADDPQPNFAYFVYDGVPAWRGALQPGSSDPAKAEVVTYPAELMRSLPVYHLLARAVDVENCQYNAAYDNTAYYFSGTLVYDGQVYDNIHFRVRGQYSTFRTGKNKWKIDFNRGHYFQARDDYGRKYARKWDKLNVGTGTCPWWQYPHPGPWDQGTRGMLLNEPLAYRLYNLAGVPSCRTHFFQLRVIDAAEEASSTSQYEGDFWGLYYAIEQPDGAFLDEHDLPDGNLYRMDGGANQTHQAHSQPDDQSDLDALRFNHSESGWAAHFDLDRYYGYRAVGIAVNDSDRRFNSNCIYYHNALTDQWWILPWDLDLTFEWASHWTDWEHIQNALQYPTYRLAAESRARELLDLLFNGEQAAAVIDEIAAVIATPIGGRRFVEANQAQWDHHPRTQKKGQFYQNNEFLQARDWDGLVAYTKQFLTAAGFADHGGSYGVHALTADTEDPRIPRTPTVTYRGTPGWPSNDLRFEVSPFSDPQGSGTFGALQWRLARVESADVSAPTPTEPQTVVLLPAGSPAWRYRKGTAAPSSPVTAWRQPDFDDSGWAEGQTSIGYGDGDDQTVLGDMRNQYSSIYLRRRFNVPDVDALAAVTLRVYVDDGCILWINGQEVSPRLHVSAGFKAHDDLTGAAYVDNAAWESIDLPVDLLVDGSNQLAIHVLNSSLSSSDLSIDVEILGRLAGVSGSEPVVTPVPVRRPGHYEIEPVWFSDEITSWQPTVWVPGSVVEPGRPYRVRCRMRDQTGRWSHWSAPVAFVAGEPLAAGVRESLRITELMAHPAPAGPGEPAVDQDAFEFIEVANAGDEPLDLSTVALTRGVQFDFADGSITHLEAGRFVLVVSDRDAFLARYGAALADRVAGVYQGHLSNGGETVRLEDYFNGVIAEFTYDDGPAWPAAADGAGHSYVPRASSYADQPAGSLSDPAQWRASTWPGGSPGQADPEPVTSLVLNEVMPHTDLADSFYPAYDSNDWIEVVNAGDVPVELAGWFLGDRPDRLDAWPLPAEVLAPGQRIVFDEVHHFHASLSEGFGLNKAGEAVFLSQAQDDGTLRVADALAFRGVDNGVSLARVPDGTGPWFRAQPTAGRVNGNVLTEVLITELMVVPQDALEEYLELTNPHDVSWTLESEAGPWRLDGAVDFVFPAGFTLPPHGRVVVVPFDPQIDVSRRDAWAAAVGAEDLVAGQTLLGPFSGSLAREGERLSLQKPQAPDEPGQGLSWVDIDTLTYAPNWPIEPGRALTRQDLRVDRSSGDAANWRGAAATPGF